MFPRTLALPVAALVGGVLLSALLVPGPPAAASVAAASAGPAPSAGLVPARSVGTVTVDPDPTTAAAQWSVAPADASGPDGRISLRHTIEPGGSATDAIAVTNLGAEPATYAVAAGDGVIGDDGAFDIVAGAPQDSGTWIAVDGLQDGAVAVAPGETRILPLRITVPAGVTPGDHPAGIVVGVTRADDGVTVTHRVGVRLHLQVAGDIAPAVEIGGVTASFTPSWIPFAPGTLRVETVVVNTGNVRLGALLGVAGTGVDTADPGGAGAPDPVEMLPGDTATVVRETSAWPLFALFGSATVRPVAIGDDAVSAPPLVEQGFVTPAPSWTGLALVILVAGGVAAIVIARRRTGRDGVAVDPPTPEPLAPAAREDAVTGVR